MKRYFYIFLAVSVLSSSMLISQPLKDLPFAYSALDNTTEVRVFVKTEKSLISNYEKQGELRILGEVKEYSLIALTKSKLLTMVGKGELEYISTNIGRGVPLNDLMVTNNNILPVHQGISPLDTAYSGQGVIMGIIDTGVELLHPDFLNEDGTTRVLELWDHTFEFDEEHIPQPYGFGTRWTKEEIDQGIAIHQDQAIWFGHGSTVTGTACGNGSAIGDYKGVAPKSDMVIVSFDFGTPNFLEDVVQAVDYIFQVAEQHQKPCVINMSLGTYFGSHDANDPASLFIEEQLEQPGRLIAAAVGNSNAVDPYHVGVELNDDTAFTWFEIENSVSSQGPGVFFELWADAIELEEVSFIMGADRTETPYENRGSSVSIQYTDALGQLIAKPIINSNEDTLAIAQFWAQLQGEQVQMQVLVSNPDSSQFDYRLQGMGTGRYDIWSTSVFGTSDMVQFDALPTLEEFPEIVNYAVPDRRMHMVSSWACSDRVITVGNYMNRTSYVDYTGNITSVGGTQGDIYISSSAGPTRDGRQKPDIAATGSVTLSTGNFQMLEFLIQNEPFKVAPGGMHFRNGGSSMASPVLAGLAALYLEQCPFADWQDFKTAVINTAAVDTYTGDTPNEYWGYGKVNGFGLIAHDAIVPQIEQQGQVLIASGGSSYQWYADSIIIEGETESTLEISGQGDYQVEVFNEDGCSVFSDAILVTSLSDYRAHTIGLSPNPAEDLIEISNLPQGVQIEVIDSYGRKVIDNSWYDIRRIDVSALQSGLYFVRVLDVNNPTTLPFLKE